ncbi:MAG: hypothetical protein ACKVVP_14020 [Chloroflexota bacterium]
MSLQGLSLGARALMLGLGLAVLFSVGAAPADAKQNKKKKKPKDEQTLFTENFRLNDCKFQNNGRNAFFILEPGFQLRYEGKEDDETVALTITVLNDTKVIGGVDTRIVEERDWVNGELVEVSLNYFALCGQTSSVYYFGEDVDIYEKGRVVSHDGAWHHGENGARAGLIMPSEPLLGARFMQEIAPGVALDRGEIVGVSESVQTPAGRFDNCVKVTETSGMDPKDIGQKIHCPGVGLVKDKDVLLTRYGQQ